MYIGAEFRKADLQVHSPRDSAWRGPRPDDELRANDTTAINASRMEWANEFIDACVANGLGVVALTDHHEGVYLWSVMKALAERRASDPSLDLWLLPGMELTTRDAVQALLLFDQDMPREFFEKARSLLKLPTDCAELESRGIAVEAMDHDVAELHEVLHSDAELKGRFIVLPNVTPGGYKTMLRKGFHPRFRNMPYVGGYLDAKYPDELEKGSKRILDGEIPAWNSQKLGLICTSDARDADFSRLGSYCTWLKMARPTAESLRQALLAADSRISYAPPDLPSITIDSLSVSGSDFISEPKFLFNPQFTAFIGGRGAGKSTLLEYLWFALGRSALDEPEAAWNPTWTRRCTLLDGTLTGEASVAASLTIDGAVVKLSRTIADADRIRYEANGEESVLTPADVRQLIPIQTFSQGELSHVGGEGAQERLLDLLGDSRREEVDGLKEHIATAQRCAVDALWQNADAWTLEQKKTRLTAQLRTLTAQAVNLGRQLESAPAAARATIEQHGLYNRAAQAVEELSKTHDSGSDAVLASIREHLGDLQSGVNAWSDLGAVPQIAGRKPTVEAKLRELVGLEQQFIELGNSLDSTFRSGISAVEQRQKELGTEYKAALDKLTGHKKSADHLKQVEERIGLVSARQSALDKQLRDLASAPTDLRTAIKSFEKYLRNLLELTAEVATSAEQLTGGLVIAEPAATPDCTDILEALKGLFSGSHVRETRIDSMATQVREAADPVAEWIQVLREIVMLLRWKHRGESEAGVRPRCPFLEAKVDPGGLDRFISLLTPERVTSALESIIRPRLDVLQSRGRERIPFGQASQGEKAATLLVLLMNQEAGPLLVDQPEEDLDNRIINDIVATTCAAKRRRQLIFATHNANLVVNADAEYVIELTGGDVTNSGAIDDRELRDAIAETIEGGRAAFELRRKKYNF